MKKKLSRTLNSRVFYFILLVFTVLYVITLSSKPKESIYTKEEEVFEGKLESIKIKEEKATLELSGGELLICNYYLDESKDFDLESFPLGSKIRVKGSLKEPSKNTVPNTFNYKDYLNKRGIYYICTINDIEIDSSNIGLFYKIKNAVIKRISSFDIDGYLSTMIIGNKSALDEETLDNYKKNGVVHLFAISGMHIGLFSSLLLALFKKIKLKKNKAYISTIACIWFYAFLTGFPSSVLRAGLLFSFLAVNKIFSLEIKTINVLLLVGVTLILCNYNIVYDVGFIFSFVTTFGLIYERDILKSHKILGTSVVAFLYSLPITCYSFYKFNLASIVLNIIFVPLVSTVIYPLCLITFVVRPLEVLTKLSIAILELLNDIFSKFDLLVFIVPKPSIFAIVLYYVVLIMFLKKKFWKTSIFLIGVFLMTKVKPFIDPNEYVEFLDVGQGDSVLLRSSNSKDVILIDTGGQVTFKDRIIDYHISQNTITYLYSLGIDKIDYLILTHGDADHMGEAIYLVDNFKVEDVIFNCGTYNELEIGLTEILDAKKIESHSCIEELNIKNSKLNFLNTKEYDNENDNSSVIFAEFSDVKFMFMGDASTKVEENILKKYTISNIDVLKVGHHGSKTSSNKSFISKIDPKYSIISVGKNNRYGHPNKEVLESLNSSKIYRTDRDGSIMFKIKNNKIKVKTYAS